MAKKLYSDTSVQAIANAIRSKNQTQNTYKIGQMSTAINSLPVLTTNQASGRTLNIQTSDIPFLFKNNKLYGECTQGENPSPSNPQEVEVIKARNIQTPNWALNYVNAVNDNWYARIVNADGKNCLYYVVSASWGSYPTQNFTLGITFKPNTQYTFSFDLKSSDGTRVFGIHYTDGTWSYNTEPIANTWTHYDLISEPGKTIDYVCPYYTLGNVHIDINTFMIREGTTILSYIPYGYIRQYVRNSDLSKEQLVDINIGQNELCSNKNLSIKDDVISGKITKKIGKVDLGTLNWSPVNQLEESKTQGLFCSWGISNIKAFSDMGEAVKNLSNKYVMKGAYPYFYPGRNPDDKTMAQYDVVIYVQNSDFSGYTNEQVKAALSGTILYYELATPQEITIPEFTTPFTYNGATNISNSENANMEIEYYKII